MANDPLYPGFSIERRDAIRVKEGDIIHFNEYNAVPAGLYYVTEKERKGTHMIYISYHHVYGKPYKTRMVRLVTDKVNVYTPTVGDFKPGDQQQEPGKPPINYGDLFQ